MAIKVIEVDFSNYPTVHLFASQQALEEHVGSSESIEKSCIVDDNGTQWWIMNEGEELPVVDHTK